MKKAERRQERDFGRLDVRPAGLLAILALLFGCSPESGLTPTSRSATPAPKVARPAVSRPEGGAEAGAAAEGPPPAASSRPTLLEPIVEQRAAGSGRGLGEEDLRDLGELSILPHVIQSISSGAPCDFNDAMSTCQ
jgi:hypothetical protein